MFVSDTNECATDTVCAQQCVNTFGSYQCSCGAGYARGADPASCVAINGETR